MRLTDLEEAVPDTEDALSDGAPPADDETGAAPSEQTQRSWVLRGAALLALAATVFLAVSAVSWWRAEHDSSLEFAQTRDAVLIDARREVEVLTTLDYQDVDAGLDRWLAVSTGDLHDQLGGVDETARQALEDAAKVSTGTVVDAALTDLDVRAGSASGIATVEIKVLDEAGETTVKRDRFSVELARVKGDWLVSRLDQVQVELS